jgi:SOS response regulatory protein OraA/RecX
LSDPDDDPSLETRRDDTAALATVVRRWAYAAVAAREVSEAVLTRRLADKAARRFPDSEPAARRAAVQAAVAACVGHGLVDDARFADLTVRSGVARGRSRRRIALTLQDKGVAAPAALAEVDDLVAALRLLRRRRLGPWGAAVDDAPAEDDMDDASQEDRRGWARRPAARPDDRALGLLMRNGFTLDTARKALAFDRETAEEHLASAPGT